MTIEKIAFLNTSKERLVFWCFLVVILLGNLTFKYMHYLTFIQEEFLKTKVTVLNIYPKQEYQVLRLQTSDFEFFTAVNKDFKTAAFKQYEVVIVTANISFLQFLKGFYTKSMLFRTINSDTLIFQLSSWIAQQHSTIQLQQLYQALFLAQPLPTNMRSFFSNMGISHLIAISGFHLSVLSFCLYMILLVLYKPIHQRFLLYRHRRFDILIAVALILFLYLILTDFVPSLLRAFIMMLSALILLRHNITIFSYETLLLTFGVIIACFPQYLFSIGLWFSIIAVFYIYLFLDYFQKGHKVVLTLWFNIWIFLIFNPIVHFFFGNTSYEQLFSPLMTILFTLFYPLVLLLHLTGYGAFLDESLLLLLNHSIESFELLTPWWFFVLFCVCSLCSIVKKEAFYLLNILALGFNFYLYLTIP